MGEVLVAIGVTLLVITLTWTTWWLIGSSRRERRRRRIAAGYVDRYRIEPGVFGGRQAPAHQFRGQHAAVTVSELLADAANEGHGRQLHWVESDLDEVGRVRPYARDQLPTEILPRIEDFGREEL